MCGRTACTLAPDEVRRACTYRNRRGQRSQPRWKDGDADKYRPSYNKSPQSNSPVLLSQRHFDQSAPVDECVLASMRWGLVPNWFKENDANKLQYSTNNCRSETILEKKTYKDPLLKGQRCVILADGFYEWRRQGKDKQPFFIYFPQSPGVGPQREPKDESQSSASNDQERSKETMSNMSKKDTETEVEWTGWRLLTMAGLFDCWTPPGGDEPLYTYTVITVNASSNLEGIHDRMPAILDGEEEVRKWLDFGEIKSLDALKLLQSKNILTYHPVSSLVNNSRNNTAECLQPVCLNKKEPVPTASSKMMMSWLKGGAPQKRKVVVETGKEQIKDKSKTETKSTGLVDQWLHGTSKKPKTQ